MKILLAPDKFRGSLQAHQVVEAMKEGVRLADPTSIIDSCELADGGEGTLAILVESLGGSLQTIQVLDPLGRSLQAQYGLSADTKTAFIEMAAASGLALLAKEEQDPWFTSTYGTGQLIAHALNQGAKTIYIGIGGSATNDAGMGMAAALGYQFLNSSGEALSPMGGNMHLVEHIDASQVNPLLQEASFIVLSDVTNPLVGETGAARVYGPQKGAVASRVEQLEQGLVHFNTIVTEWIGKDYSAVPGAGAAGGLGFGSLAFLKAQLQSGVHVVMKLLNIQQKVQEADLVITGEGKIDTQTLHGKVIGGLSAICQEYQKPLIVVSGAMLLTPLQLQQAGITCAVSIMNRPMDDLTAYREAYERVVEATFNLVRLFSFQRV